MVTPYLSLRLPGSLLFAAIKHSFLDNFINRKVTANYVTSSTEDIYHSPGFKSSTH